MNKLLLVFTFAFLICASIAAAWPSYGWPAGACTNPPSPNGCYGGNCGALYGYWGYGQAQGNYWSGWRPMKYYYHYPGRNYFDRYSPWNQWPGPYGNSGAPPQWRY